MSRAGFPSFSPFVIKMPLLFLDSWPWSSKEGSSVRKWSLSSNSTASKTIQRRRFSLAAPVSSELQHRRQRSLSSEKDYLLVSREEILQQRHQFEPPRPRSARSDSIVSLTRSRRMGRAMRVLVVGAKKVGKTAILKNVACIEDITNKPYEPTSEDTYQVLIEEPDRPREIVILHDTAGVASSGSVELKKAYVQAADAFVLVYSVSDHESFNRVDLLKKWIDKQFGKDKKEVPIVVLANMKDRPPTVDSAFAQSWANREKVKLFEVSAKDRLSLVDFVHYIAQRHFHPSKESKFSLSKKLRSDKTNQAILMDF